MEIVRYAAELGIKEIVEQMPKDLMVKRMKALGVPPPKVPPRPIGSPARSGDTTPTSHRYEAKEEEKTETIELSADELLEREWKTREIPIEKMSIGDARKACKARGIKISRTDKLADLKAKLDGQ